MKTAAEIDAMTPAERAEYVRQAHIAACKRITELERELVAAKRDSGSFKSLTRDAAQWSTPQAFDANDCTRKIPTNLGGGQGL